MTTDNTQELDELKHILGHCPGGCNKPDCWFNAHCHLLESEMDEAQVQALLDWHNKQTLELLDRLDKSMPTDEQLTTKYGYHMPEKKYGYRLALHDIRGVLAKLEAEL